MCSVSPGCSSRRASPAQVGSRLCTHENCFATARLYGKWASPLCRDPTSSQPGSRPDGLKKNHINRSAGLRMTSSSSRSRNFLRAPVFSTMIMWNFRTCTALAKKLIERKRPRVEVLVVAFSFAALLQSFSLSP